MPTPGAYPEQGLPPGTYGWRRKRDTSGNLAQWRRRTTPRCGSSP
ncbi:MAG: hypothetical protein R2690_16515 [Acidimicrobiales bacterium]